MSSIFNLAFSCLAIHLCDVPKITETKFWTNLLAKLLRQLLNKQLKGIQPRTHHQHVVPHEDGWAIRGEGNERLTAVYEYQDDAIRRARKIARGYGSSVIIHRRDGSIRDRTSYKKD